MSGFPLEMLIKMNPEKLKFGTHSIVTLSINIFGMFCVVVDNYIVCVQTNTVYEKSSIFYDLTITMSNGRYIWMFNL